MGSASMSPRRRRPARSDHSLDASNQTESSDALRRRRISAKQRVLQRLAGTLFGERKLRVLVQFASQCQQRSPLPRRKQRGNMRWNAVDVGDAAPLMLNAVPGDSRARSAQHMAGLRAGVLAVIDRHHAVHQHPLDAGRKFRRLLVGRAILNASRSKIVTSAQLPSRITPRSSSACASPATTSSCASPPRA